MATDQSPPRLQLIISIAVGTVVALVGLKFVFDSYFTNVWEGEEQGKLVAPDEVNAMRADQIAKLTNGPAVPIDQAMSMIATKGRLSSTLITPQPSDDLGAVTGWSHLHDGEPAAVVLLRRGALRAGPCGARGDVRRHVGRHGERRVPAQREDELVLRAGAVRRMSQRLIVERAIGDAAPAPDG